MTNETLFPTLEEAAPPEHEKVYSIKEDYSFLKEKSGIYFLYYKNRCIYIGAASDLHTRIYHKTTKSSMSCSHDFLGEVEAFSVIQLTNYDRSLAEKLRDSLIATQRPFINILFKEYHWLHKDLTEKLSAANKEIYRLKDKEVTREKYEALEAKYNALLATIRSVIEEEKE